MRARCTAPLAVGLIAALITWYTWGYFKPRPAIHDEAAYILQAQIFSAGKCTAPAPPMPEFFEEFHVLMTPVVAAKYPVGQSLALAPVVWAGAPWMLPLAMTALSGALLFVLQRRLVSCRLALLGCALWLLSPVSVDYLPSYLSESTTLALGLSAWTATSAWWRGQSRWLLLAAAAIGWMAITRPLTALAWAVPIAWLVLRKTFRERGYSAVLAGGVVGLVVLAIQPWWNHCAVGHWFSGPYALYRVNYMPWDRFGFGLDSTPPLRATQPDLPTLAGHFTSLHASLTPFTFIPILLVRCGLLLLNVYGPFAVILFPMALFGIRERVLWVPVATLGLVLIGYGLYAHPFTWLAYYVEVVPVLASLPVVALEKLTRAGRRYLALLGELTVIALLAAGLWRLPEQRTSHRAMQESGRRFDASVAALPNTSAIVFVRYGLDHNVNRSLVQNAPFFARARVWVAYDRGDYNKRLSAKAPERAVYLYDEATGTMTPLMLR